MEKRMGTFPDKIQGGHLLAKSLAEKNIKKVFSLSGGFLNAIFDGCVEYGVEVVGTRSEQEASFLADAYCRITREPCVCLSEPSGFTNTVSGVAEAYNAGDPVIFISAGSIFHRLDRWGFKETAQHRVVETMTKYSIQVSVGARIPEFVDKAYDIAINQPTGPVQISIPVNFLFSHYPTAEKEVDRLFDLSKVKIHRPFPNPDDVEFVEKTLMEAKKPVIIAGPWIWQSKAEKELEGFSSSVGIPYFVPPWHEKMIDMTYFYNMGLVDIHQNPASRLIYEEADLIMFIGCRLDYTLDFGEPPLFNKETKLIAVNSSSKELSDNHIADIRVLSDLKAFLSELKQKAKSLKVDADWVEKIRSEKSIKFEEFMPITTSNEVPIHPLRLCIDVLNSLKEKDYLVIDGGDTYGWFETALSYWSLEEKKIGGILNSGSFDQLGVGVSFATAAKMANPESNVVLITGDGALGLAPGLPMETAIHYELPITVIVVNNQQWGMIQQQQKGMWHRTYKTDLRDVPYHKMFEGMGAYAQLVEDPNDIKPAVKRAFDSKVPSFIEARTKSVPSPITAGLIDVRTRSSAE